jgi:(S)-3,5-dihydroxyphenylglycine transaminase
MERSARDYAVSWAPMSMFHLDGGGERALRLGFSNLTPAAIREGIARLARFVKAESASEAAFESASLPEFVSASEAHA